jgi:hypothetical protein
LTRFELQFVDEADPVLENCKALTTAWVFLFLYKCEWEDFIKLLASFHYISEPCFQ